MASVMVLQALDYMIIAVVALVFVGIGFYFACLGKKQRTTKEYFLGDGNMNSIPIVMSIIASFFSSTAMLGITVEIYYFGFNYLWVNLGTFIGGPIAIYGFMPVFHKLGFTSIFEYIECHFNKSLSVCLGIMDTFNMLVFASFSTYTPALALSQENLPMAPTCDEKLKRHAKCAYVDLGQFRGRVLNTRDWDLVSPWPVYRAHLVLKMIETIRVQEYVSRLQGWPVYISTHYNVPFVYPAKPPAAEQLVTVSRTSRVHCRVSRLQPPPPKKGRRTCLMTGLTIWTAILSTTVIGTLYTSIVQLLFQIMQHVNCGGIKAVVWTDALQLLIFLGALTAVIINSNTSVGSFSYIFSKNIEGHRLDMISFSADPRIRYTFWGLTSYSVVEVLTLYGANQVTLQRYLCCRNKKTAQRTIWISLIGHGIIIAVFCFIGLILYAMYWNCDPLASRQIQKPDQLFPLFVMQTMSSIPGMLGLFVGAVFCAALSTISSMLNSLAAITIQGLFKPRRKSLSDNKAALISKFIAAAYGIICVLMIAVIMNLGNVVQAVRYVVGGTVGAHLGLFVLGLMNPWANSKGSFLGMVCGLAMGWWISIGNQIHKPPPNSLLPISTLNCTDILGDDWTPQSKPHQSAYKAN
uniref:Sodium-dependent multivitamin transporter n=1 Tax=Strigamia maritima TaxID=126957 RepID=T1ILQ5_STRMM